MRRSTMTAAGALVALASLTTYMVTDTVSSAPATAEVASEYRAETLTEALQICETFVREEVRPCRDAAFRVTWPDWDPVTDTP